MEITIRPAEAYDLDRIMQIFDAAKKFMRSKGNLKQWTGGYPQRELIAKEISLGHCHVCTDTTGNIAATFCLIPSPDHTYATIYDGHWLNDEPYHVIHRLASDGSVKGIGKICIDWCILHYGELRIDTHADNIVMQALAEHCGFVKCGIIYIDDGTPRIAYQRPANRPSQTSHNGNA